MVKVLLIMTGGIVLGYFIRRSRKIIAINDKLVMLAVFGLLFLMGVAIGSNAQIVNRLPELGATALLFALAGTVFSVVFGAIVYFAFFKKHH